MEAIITQLTSKEALKFIAQVENIFKSVPHLPKGIVEFLVKIAPWLALVGGVLSVIGGISSLSGGLGAEMSWMRLAGYSSTFFLISGVFQLLAGGLLLLSFKYLKTQHLTGWVLLFWEMVISIVQSIALMALWGGLNVMSVLWILIWLYVLFEMKPKYKA